MTHRIERIESLIKQEISQIILFKLHDPVFGFITVTNVKVSPDLKLAKIYFSVFEKEKRKMVLEKLQEVSGLVRSELGSRIRLRHVPDVKFYIDDTLDYVEKIENLIKKIHENHSSILRNFIRN